MTQTWGKTLGLFECSRPRAHEAGAHGKAPEYRRRAPKESTLYQAIQVGLPALLQALQSQDKTLPFHLAREFEEFQKCGVLEHGFIRVKCTQCRHEKIVGFSCKRRGFCASCAGKRRVESGVFLSEVIFPGNALQTASVSVIQRFCGALNLNIHFHQLGVDGSYAGTPSDENACVRVHLLKSEEPTMED